MCASSDAFDAGAPVSARLPPPAQRLLQGLGVSPGWAGGPVVRLAGPPSLPAVMPTGGDPGEELRRALAALHEVGQQLEARAAQADGPSATGVLLATSMMARDPGLAESVEEFVHSGLAAAWAVDAAIARHHEILARLGGYIGERADDLRDVGLRAVALLVGADMPGVPERDHPFILVAEDLAPADTATLRPDQVHGLVTTRGGPTSHTAILARAMGLPAVVACPDASGLVDDDRVVIDGSSGNVLVNATETQVASAAARRSARAVRSGGGPGTTRDGHPVQLLINAGSIADASMAASVGAAGIGLFRTELLYLGRHEPPGFAEQRVTYAAVMSAVGSGRVVIRTLDAGADKPMPFLRAEGEANPALGVRGLRTARRRPELLEEQVGAVAAAARDTGADVWVMAPMVSTGAEALMFAELCAGHGLAAVGAMVEVPAAALRAGELLSVLDFLSIGTNDLAQYTLAVDRVNGELADLLDPWQPAVLQLVAMTAGAAAAAGKPVGVCGEAAADPHLARVLVGLGATSLSMSPRAVADVRAALAEVTFDDCRDLAEQSLRPPTKGR